MQMKSVMKKLDIKSALIGVLSTLLIITIFYFQSLNAGPQDQPSGQNGNFVVRSLTVVNAAGNPVFSLAADSTGNGVMVMRSGNNKPMVLMRSVEENQVETGVIYCNGIGIWGSGGKVNTLINANSIQHLNQ